MNFEPQPEEELASSEAKYRALFDYAGDAIIIYDLDGVIIAWNRMAEQIFGYSAEEAIGCSYGLIVPPDLEVDKERVGFELLRGTGSFQFGETERARKDGTRIPVEISVAALKGREGNITGACAIMRDVSERKRLEREKEEAQAELLRSERLSAVGQLASVVAHELRQPLSVINSSVYYLNMKLNGAEEKVKNHLDILSKEVNLAAGIISDLLDFARPKEPILRPVEIISVVEGALSRTSVPPNMEVALDFEPDLPQLWADAERLERLFVNLIRNAIEAMTDGGRLEINARQRDDSIQVSVRDNGVGISEESLSQIFQPLYSTKAKGTGLGLAISKQIVELHRGTIEVESGPETTFTIKVPIRPEGC